MSEPVRITIRTSDGEQTLAPEAGAGDVKLSQWLRSRGRPLNTRCGGRGLCDACQVDLAAGSLRRLSDGEPVTFVPGDESLRLRACEHALLPGAPATLAVPDRSLLAFEPQVIADFRLEVPIGKAPLWPSPHEQPGNADRPVAGPPLAAAIDIGTTTVALLLIDLDTGAVLARTSSFNRQTHLGDDVLTRINLCMTDPEMLGRLQHAITHETLAPLLRSALEQAGAAADQLVLLTAAGNATMLHLLIGEDPTPMGIAPFTPRFLQHRAVPLSAVGLRLDGADRDPTLHLLPGAAAYVGADLTAGIVATGMRYEAGNVLLVDVGTNGEIILSRNGTMLGCATAAGPAFEGSRLHSGVRAVRGAISHIDMAGESDALDLRLETIGDGEGQRVKPIGLCGSAYVDFLAEGVRSGVLGASGRFDIDRAGVAGRLVTTDAGRGLKLAEASGKEPICVTEADVAALLQAKGAIAAGITTLLQRAGLTAADIDTLYLAGGFGMHMRVASAIGCGLLPGFRPEQVRLVGNTSLAGAFMAAMDRAVLEEMSAAATAIEIVELNLDPNFEMNYIDHLSLPEPV